MKNGSETRSNGSVITKVKRPSGFNLYYVQHKDGTPSRNGPWDYLANARKDADGGIPCHN